MFGVAAFSSNQTSSGCSSLLMEPPAQPQRSEVTGQGNGRGCGNFLADLLWLVAKSMDSLKELPCLSWSPGPVFCLLLWVSSGCFWPITGQVNSVIRAHFLSYAGSKLRLCSANHRAGYFSNLACDCLSIVWAYSEQETENGPRSDISDW